MQGERIKSPQELMRHARVAYVIHVLALVGYAISYPLVKWLVDAGWPLWLSSFLCMAIGFTSMLLSAMFRTAYEMYKNQATLTSQLRKLRPQFVEVRQQS